MTFFRKANSAVHAAALASPSVTKYRHHHRCQGASVCALGALTSIVKMHEFEIVQPNVPLGAVGRYGGVQADFK